MFGRDPLHWEQVPLGYSIAATVRVGHALGAGDIVQAKKSVIVSLLMTEGSAIASCILLVSIKDVIAYVYTSDEAIVELVSYVLPVYAVCHLFDGCVSVCCGILRGTGKQKIGAIFHAIGYYVICLPVAVSLMFAAKIGIIGFWLGALACAFLQIIAFLTFVFRIDWVKAAQEAQSRAKERLRMTHDADNKLALYHSALETEEAEASKTRTLTDLEVEQRPDEAEDQSASPNPAHGKKLLCKRELIVRRCLVLLAGIVVLMIGILIRLSV